MNYFHPKIRSSLQHKRKNLPVILAMASKLILLCLCWTVTTNPLAKAEDSPVQKTKFDLLGQDPTNHRLIILPSLVDQRGNFLSSDVTYNGVQEIRRRSKRHAEPVEQNIYYQLPVKNHVFYLNLTVNNRLVSSNYHVEVWGSQKRHRRNLRHHQMDNCYYHGVVVSHPHSRVAISNCRHGLHGVLAIGGNHFFIEPLKNSPHKSSSEPRSSVLIPHALYSTSSNFSFFCGLSENQIEQSDLNIRHLNKKSRHSKKRRHRRSTSIDRYVETLVVADPQAVLYHGEKDIEGYILTLMNIPGLDITHHAGHTLNSFCHWQAAVQPDERERSNSEHGISYHDNAVLITRQDICYDKDEPCDTLGLAQVSGMCDPERSCSVTQDIGLVSGYTIAHEMGHNFGMHHDGTGNLCGITKRNSPGNIMSTQLSRLGHPVTWSKCSRQYITDFLDSGLGECLLNVPPIIDYGNVALLPGERYNADDQCKAQYGPKSTRCRKLPFDLCKALWCSKAKGRCVTNYVPMLDGTPCSSKSIKKGWCYNGICVPRGTLPQSGDGQWGEWSSWSQCSRTCGGGVQSSGRECNNPRPSHGGKFCIGERKKYRTCNLQKCPASAEDYRLSQCSEYNKKEFRGKYYKWIPYNGVQLKPCTLYCQAVGFNFYVEKSAKVADGTRCYADSRDICVNGQCMQVGCDGQLGSKVPEDRCRVCGGDGSTCQTRRGFFNHRLDSRINTYAEVVKIPKGAVHILISELSISKNYLAVRGSDGSFYINGKWEVKWPAIYEVAGTRFHYMRPEMAPESLRALGPISEELTIMVLLQEPNKGIRYEFNAPSTPGRSLNTDDFEWTHAPWSECSKSCAKGISIAEVICTHKADKSKVSDIYCSSKIRPAEMDKECNTQPCEPEWSVGQWSECSVSCGGGHRYRSVHCIQKLDYWEEKILDDGLCLSKRPIDHELCSTQKCPNTWYIGWWSECLPKCGKGQKKRPVICFSPLLKKELPLTECPAESRPNDTQECKSSVCPPSEWTTGPWTACNTSCGLGKQNRTVTCKNWQGSESNECAQHYKPQTQQECYVPCKESADDAGCKDVNKAGYCHLVLKLEFCSRPYFRKMCCKSCTASESSSKPQSLRIT